ncbi:translational protein [Lithospermum erythrorhizon]|uniref:arginyltransferase n=1 Tax=Lithospermum erythrorhizon TaxID=34254 RepID=A0AAV3QY12_LITER
MKKMKSEASSSGGGGGGESVVADAGRRKSSCGYCKSTARSSISHGLWARSLTVHDYQALLDRGWRRSGSLLYKPDMERTCCPSYTIRLKACDFSPSKEQRRVLNRIQSISAYNSSSIISMRLSFLLLVVMDVSKKTCWKFLEGTLDEKDSSQLMDYSDAPMQSGCPSSNENSSSAGKQSISVLHDGKDEGEKLRCHLGDQIDRAMQAATENSELQSNVQFPKASVKSVAPTKRKILGEGSENLLFSSNVAFQISAASRKYLKDVTNSEVSEQVDRGIGHLIELSPKMIAEILVNYLKHVADSTGFTIKACNGHINFYASPDQAAIKNIVGATRPLVQSSAQSVVKDNSSKVKPAQAERKARKFEIRTKKSSYDPEEYSLYRKYQIRVHNDTPEHVSEFSYMRFLVDTPLVFVPPTGDGTVPPCGFGSFHQQYLIDGKLVAVGVVDILPKCLSSKYLFWDPDLAFLSLGKFSALRELKWVRENEVHCPTLQYYYLGYYIHSCNKMRYKASYRPSELLCPLRYEWISFDIARPLLDQNKYVVLSDFSTSHDGQSILSNVGKCVEQQNDDTFQEGPNYPFVGEDAKMVPSSDESEEDESDSETPESTFIEVKDGDLDNILIGLKASRLKYKDLRHAIGSSDRKYRDAQVLRYKKVVGPELSERMVYTLG